MKVLILSCGTGGGHNDAGRGTAEALKARGHEAVFLNEYLGLAGKRVDQLIYSLYMNTVTRRPELFRAVYGLGRGVSSALHPMGLKSPVYLLNAGKLARALGELIEKERFDAVIMSHLYPAETLTALKRRGRPLPPTIAVATDHTAIPFWEENECDWYIVPDSDTLLDFEHRGVPREKLVPLGIPAPIAFTPPEDREAVRKALGFEEGKKYILLMSGSMGAGDISGFIYNLRGKMDSAAHLIAVCGKNEPLWERLRLVYGSDPQVTVIGYLQDTARYMQACDLLFTKPGGLTTTESALCRIPTVLLPAISQCEDANRKAFLKARAACQGENDDERIARGLKLLEPENAARMRRAQKRMLPENPAVKLAAFTERMVTGLDRPTDNLQ